MLAALGSLMGPKQKEKRSDNRRKVRFEGSRVPVQQSLPVTDYWKDWYC